MLQQIDLYDILERSKYEILQDTVHRILNLKYSNEQEHDILLEVDPEDHYYYLTCDGTIIANGYNINNLV